MSDTKGPGLLGLKVSRKFKIYREAFPAIFRFNGQLFQEEYDIDAGENRWVEITEETAERWLRTREVADGRSDG